MVRSFSLFLLIQAAISAKGAWQAGVTDFQSFPIDSIKGCLLHLNIYYCGHIRLSVFSY